MKAVSNMAVDHWNERFAAAELEAWKAEQAAISIRRKSETLYRTSPFGEPKLLDEVYGQSRTLEQLVWAETRLRSLSFDCVLEANTQTWVDEQEDYIVYADPRLAKKIDFWVWRKPLPRRFKRGSRFHHPDKGFFILDSWKKNLPVKYAEQVAQGLSR